MGSQKNADQITSVYYQGGTLVLKEIADLIDAGQMKVRVSRTYPLADVKQASDIVRRTHTLGK